MALRRFKFAILMVLIVVGGLPSGALAQGTENNTILMGFNQITGVSLGVGVDIASRRKTKKCLINHRKSTPSSEPFLGFARSVPFDKTWHHKKGKLAELMGLNLSVQVDVATGAVDVGGGVKVDYLSTLDVSEESTILLLRAGQHFDPYYLDDMNFDSEGNYLGLQLQQKYVDMLNQPGGKTLFEAECGTGFVYAVQEAAEFYGFARESTSSRNSYTELSVEGDFYFKGYGVDASLDVDARETRLEELTDNQIYTQIIPPHHGGARTFQELEDKWYAFNPNTAQKERVAVVIVPYTDFVTNMPSGPAFPSPSDAQMDVFASVAFNLGQLLGRVDRVLKYPELFALGLTDATRTLYRQQLMKLKEKWFADKRTVSDAAQMCISDGTRCDEANNWVAWSYGEANELLPKMKLFDCSSARFKGGDLVGAVTDVNRFNLVPEDSRDFDPGYDYRLTGYVKFHARASKSDVGVEARVQMTEWMNSLDKGPKGWKRGIKSHRTNYAQRHTGQLFSLYNPDPTKNLWKECQFADDPFGVGNKHYVRMGNWNANGGSPTTSSNNTWGFYAQKTNGVHGWVKSSVLKTGRSKATDSVKGKVSASKGWSLLNHVQCERNRAKIKKDRVVNCSINLAPFNLKLVNKLDAAAQSGYSNLKKKINSYLGLKLRIGRAVSFNRWKGDSLGKNARFLSGQRNSQRRQGRKLNFSTRKPSGVKLGATRLKDVRNGVRARLRSLKAKRGKTRQQLTVGRVAAPTTTTQVNTTVSTSKQKKCTKDKDCKSGKYCSSRKCLKKKKAGKRCKKKNECKSARCSKGRCIRAKGRTGRSRSRSRLRPGRTGGR